MTTLPGRPYNGVFGLDATASADDALSMVARLAASPVSWCARLRPTVSRSVDGALEGVGIIAQDETLLMATTSLGRGGDPPNPPDLTLRTGAVEDSRAIAEVLAAAFGTPPSSAAQLLDRAHISRAPISWHLGVVGEEPVTCAMAVLAGEAVGLFAVGTVPNARGRGYASAVTTRALRHGFAAGASFAVLTASPDVRTLYEGLGFQVLESWRRLVPSS